MHFQPLPHAGVEHATPRGIRMDSGPESSLFVFASVFAPRALPPPAPFSMLDSRAYFEDADQPLVVFYRVSTSS